MAWDHSLTRHERGYGYEWTKRRAAVLARDLYLCQPCLSKGRPTQATEVDHIVPKSQDGTDDFENLQAICRPCHATKTKAEAKGEPVTRFDREGYPIW